MTESATVAADSAMTILAACDPKTTHFAENAMTPSDKKPPKVSILSGKAERRRMGPSTATKTAPRKMVSRASNPEKTPWIVWPIAVGESSGRRKYSNTIGT